MIGRMVWWESAAAPTRDEQALKFAQTWCRSKPRLLNFDELLGSFGRRSRLDWFGFQSFGRRSRLGSFGFARDVGFVRSTQPLGLVWLYASRRSFGWRSRSGSFGFTPDLGFVRSTQPLGFVRIHP
jgi:hypothetical protein